MRIGAFGHGLPYGIFASIGATVEDVTTLPPVPCDAVADFIEPFMDPFAASLLRRLGSGALSDHDALVFLRESPGALPAFHYACEFERRGLLPIDAPRLFVLNVIPSLAPATMAFNQTEIARLRSFLCLDRERTAFAAPESRRRPIAMARSDQTAFALLGAPLGNRTLHALLDHAGRLVFDRQEADATMAARGTDLESALAAQADNPFAARQPRDLYLAALDRALQENRIDKVIWQLDAHDDLWGWLAPEVRRLCEKAGATFVDLGILPRWPNGADLAQAARLLGVEDTA